MGEYINKKLNILRELNIKLTDEQKRQMKALRTEVAIDNYCRPLIINGYERYGY